MSTIPSDPEFLFSAAATSGTASYSRPHADSLFREVPVPESPDELGDEIETPRASLRSLEGHPTAANTRPASFSSRSSREIYQTTREREDSEACLSSRTSSDPSSSSCVDLSKALVRSESLRARSTNRDLITGDQLDQMRPSVQECHNSHREVTQSLNQKGDSGRLKRPCKRRINHLNLGEADNARAGSIRKVYRRSRYAQAMRLSQFKHNFTNGNLRASPAVSPIAIPSQRSDMLALECNDFEFRNTCTTATESSSLGITEKIERRSSPNTPGVFSRVVSAGEREKTLNKWSSDESNDGHTARPATQDTHARPTIDVSNSDHRPFRSAFKEIDVNSAQQTRFRSSITSLDHRDVHLPRVDISRNVPAKHEQVRCHSKSTFWTSSRQSTLLPERSLRPLMQRGRSSLSKVRSAIQGFEDKILENKVWADRRASYHSTSPLPRPASFVSENDKPVQD